MRSPSLCDEKAKIKALEDERTCEQLGSANRKINELSSITNDSCARDEIRPPVGVCKPVQDRFLSVFNSVADNERNKFKGAIHHRLAWLPVIIKIDPATDIPKPLPYPNAGADYFTTATAAAARDQVQVAGSSTVLPYASIVAEAFGDRIEKEAAETA